jgi:hypothetical protein
MQGKQKRKPSPSCWKEGQSGNPKGAPKKADSLTNLMKEFLKSKPKGSKSSYKELFIRKAYHKAVQDGDMAAMKLIWNYVDGMPKGDNTENHAINLMISIDKTKEIKKALEDI